MTVKLKNGSLQDSSAKDKESKIEPIVALPPTTSTAQAIAPKEITLAPATEPSAHSLSIDALSVMRNLAHEHTLRQRRLRDTKLIDNLEQQAGLIKRAYQHYSERSGQDSFLPYEAEWLLDNYYLVQRALRQINEDLPVGYYRQLPKLDAGDLSGLPRIFAVAAKIVELSIASPTPDLLASWLDAYQQNTALTMGELWAFPTMMRLALIDALALALVQTAPVLAEHDSKQNGESKQNGDSQQNGKPPGTIPSSATTEQAKFVPLLHFPAAVAPENIIAHAIPSLRTLESLDWESFFEAASHVEQQLRHDPADIYCLMDFETRNHYRNQIEQLARASNFSEVAIAECAVDLAQKAASNQPTAPWANHVGYYLIGQGAKEQRIEAQLGYRPARSRRIRSWLNDHPTLVYLGSIAVLTILLLGALIDAIWGSDMTFATGMLVLFVALVPVSSIAIGLINALLSRLLTPHMLPKLDFGEGIAAPYRSMVVIPALLSSEAEVDSLLRQLEQHFLSNTDPNLGFGLLSDFTDAEQESLPTDEALVNRAQEGVRLLNQRYPRQSNTPFYLFHRRRQWNPSEERWIGWERKRGKLHEFNQLLRTEIDDAGALLHQTSFSVCEGDLRFLPSVRFVITLDADTQLPLDSARRLVATLAHPLNHAQFDEQTGRVVSGYTVLQPRAEIKPTSANRSAFSQIFSGDTGLDLYTKAVSDVYQDFFGEGIFIGKGIYDVDAFERSLIDRVPENTLLSHDLFEGSHGRAALVTDVIVYEEYPTRYLTYASRMHRWVRGDWQLVPWLARQVPNVKLGKVPNQLSLIARWKIFDNLRRSLLSPSLLLLLAVGWLIGEDATWVSLLVWDSTVALALGLPVLIGAFTWASNALRNGEGRGFVPVMKSGVLRWLLALALLPYEAILTVDAIVRTVVRMFFTHRHLLQWTTAAASERMQRSNDSVLGTWYQMKAGPICALGLTGLILLLRPQSLPVAVPWLLVWLLSPQIAHWISRRQLHQPRRLNRDEQQRLRLLARRTWLYFEHFVGPDDNWLPPDHFQEAPLGIVAHRTSPTNIGLMLLSTLAAYDFGYDDLHSLMTRIQNCFGTLQKLEKVRGHILNWYATRTLEPLPPRYVSMVDSGNLAASLWTLRQGLEQIDHEPILRQQRWQGLVDNLQIFAELLPKIGGSASEVMDLLQSQIDQLCAQIEQICTKPGEWANTINQMIKHDWPQLNQQLVSLIDSEHLVLHPQTLRQLRISVDRVEHHLQNMRREFEWLTPWLFHLAQPPTLLQKGAPLEENWHKLHELLCVFTPLRQSDALYNQALAMIDSLIPQLGEFSRVQAEIDEAREWCVALRSQIEATQVRAAEMSALCHQLSNECEAMVQAMDFGFLYDHHRHVFHIGFNVDVGTLDRNYYDLLASEARTGSLVAIAKGDVPAKHWLHLGRSLTLTQDRRTLLSWSGTMFEYLMPTLFTHSYPFTLLQQSVEGAVDAQIKEGRDSKRPWGISEAGFYQFDANLFYQYRAFGAPTLGFKRGLGDDHVIAPYASLLALSLRPQAVMQNLEDLQALDLLGDYGFYESIDFTESRLPLGQTSAIVKSFMVHHQGMILMALVNYLDNDLMVRRFHTDPRIQSVSLLLQEQIPYLAPLEQNSEQEVLVTPVAEALIAANPWPTPTQSPFKHVHYLSNGRFSTLITNGGGGFSRWQSFDLTRWRSDSTQEDWGSWLFLHDAESGNQWSLTPQPGISSPLEPSIVRELNFAPHKVEFYATADGIVSRLEIGVSPQDDLEVRRIQLTNRSAQTRKLTLLNYSEVVLGSQNSDRRHPAFNKLFIETDYRHALNALIVRRRPRSSDETPIFMAQSLIAQPGQSVSGWFEADRRRFLGRNSSLANPLPLQGAQVPTFSNKSGATLDPILSLAQAVELQPGETLEYAILTTAANELSVVENLLTRYRDWNLVNQLFERARSQSELELRQLELTSDDLGRIQRLLGLLLYPNPALRARPDLLVANQLGQQGLWQFAISGDYPILLVYINNEDEIALVQELICAHTYWRNRNLQIDLVVLNNKETGYAQEIQGHLLRLLHRTNSEIWLNRRGGIFLLRQDTMNEASRVLLATAARVVLNGNNGALADQLSRIAPPRPALPQFQRSLAVGEANDPLLPMERPRDLQFDNGLGGFNADGSEYLIYLEPGKSTPAPWINVIANEEFGFLVSESGMGYSWAANSGENRLTPWSNDPIGDSCGELIYLRDEETVEIWSPVPLPVRANAPYLVRHGAGYSIFEHNSHGLQQEVRLFAAPTAPIKIVTLRLTNPGTRVRRVTATYYAEWVLGVNRDEMQQYIIPEYENEHHALLARNPYNGEFGERIAFLSANELPHGLTTDRNEFIGQRGRIDRPAALERIGLGNVVEAGVDPCAAYMVHLDLHPGESREVHFLLGQGANRQQSIDMIHQFQQTDQVEAAWRQVHDLWHDILGSVQVATPEPAMNLLLNRWLLYQNLACRVWGRSAFYQSSGAYGFRDQLQDVLALLHAKPALAREQILRAARHQFEAGDVLHWWHPPTGRGVRTRIADDLLWLPYVAAQYVLTTGDRSILDEKVPFLVARPLEKNEEERYGLYETSRESYALLEHCRRAIQRGLTSGHHGLPLFGAGDWNDGMNRVGIEGKGESVWLGWFTCKVLNRFAEMIELIGQSDEATRYRQRAEHLRGSLEEHAWDGNWYRRGYYDDGSPLGSTQNRECQIDAIAQSWAILSATEAVTDRDRQAMQSVRQRLVREDAQLIQLFTPPFDKTARDPGYIKGYPPGIRENGGQYTHAAIWTVWAFAAMGDGDTAESLFRLLNPIYHADSPQKVEKYRVEPYVIAADVYSRPPFVGQGGWTWYTGSAGWMYQLGIEGILGLRRNGDHLEINPSIPKAWDHYRLHYRFGASVYQIEVTNPQHVDRGVYQVTIDGNIAEDQRVPLIDDGQEHAVVIIMG